MGTGYASNEGQATERLAAYLATRAAGGAGLVITEVAAVDPLGKGFQSELGVYRDSFLKGLESLAAAIHSGGAAAALQLHHAGRETFPAVIGAQPVAPSPLGSKTLRQVPRQLTEGEIQELVESYAAAAARARKAGFDAVEVHGAHGYLINQFISPYSNKREDGYGGDAAGRFRFAREVVRAVKAEVGRDFPVLFRLSAVEAVKGGYELDYLLPLLLSLQQDGADAFHVSCGVFDSPGNPTCPGIYWPAGINVERAARVKQAVDVPVLVVGKIRDPRMAEEIISAGKADMVAFGRQHLADPCFLAKAQEERFEEIRWCLSCNQGCIERMMFELKPVRCAINPECGEERRRRKANPKTGPYLVVGAGPAGLQAAITLKEEGAEVSIVERQQEPGGQLRAASKPPGKEAFQGWADWAVRRLGELGVPMELGREADRETIGKAAWRGVVLSTGSRPLIPDIPGSNLSLNCDARQVLLGLERTGRRVLIVGAGLVGLETADYLMGKGADVTVVEEKEVAPVPSITSQGYFLNKRLKERGRLLLGSRVLEVNQAGALVTSQGQTNQIEADSVVWAVGSEPERGLVDACEEAGVRTATAGDCISPRRLVEAIHEGAKAARALLYEEEDRDSRGS
jgi:2,4-dienoyl-CoA reductase-like NADH-dependent reductase (Old Yellow Enzyme family)